MSTSALSKTTRPILLALMGLLAASTVSAHRHMSGAMPSAFTEGLLSGLGHSIVGLDHFAALS